MFVSTTRPSRPTVARARRGRKDGSEVSCGSDLTHLSPRDPRVAPSCAWQAARTLVFRRSVLVDRPARPTRGPTRGKDTVCGQRRRWPSVRGAGAPGDGTARPFLSPGAAVLVAASSTSRRPSRRPLPEFRRRRAVTIRRDPCKPDRGPPRRARRVLPGRGQRATALAADRTVPLRWSALARQGPARRPRPFPNGRGRTSRRRGASWRGSR